MVSLKGGNGEKGREGVQKQEYGSRKVRLIMAFSYGKNWGSYFQ